MKKKKDFWGRKYPSEVQVEHQTCNTICRTPLPAILNHKNSNGLAGGARKGQNMAHLGHINGQCNVMYFDLPWPLLPTVSNFYGLKRFYSFGTKTEDIFLFECPSLLCFFLQKLYCCQIILYSVKTLDYNKARSISEKYIIWLVLMP